MECYQAIRITVNHGRNPIFKIDSVFGLEPSRLSFMETVGGMGGRSWSQELGQNDPRARSN